MSTNRHQNGSIADAKAVDAVPPVQNGTSQAPCLAPVLGPAFDDFCLSRKYCHALYTDMQRVRAALDRLKSFGVITRRES